jgi:hypothetical protein
LQNVASAHDAIIASRVFQTHQANARRRDEPKIEVGSKVYLSTANLALPKGRAGKLLPKYIGPYEVLKALPETSNYELDLPEEMVKRRIHRRFHVNLLKPHQPNDDTSFPGRASVDAYDWGAPDDAEWIVSEITAHRWIRRSIEFQIRWNLGDSTWEPYEVCKDLEALDSYLTLMGVEDWRLLSKKG